MQRITASALSLNVDDPLASATFAKQHLGFTEDMADEGFVSLKRTIPVRKCYAPRGARKQKSHPS
jgi:hypothetical protein